MPHDLITLTKTLKSGAMTIHLGADSWKSFSTKVPLNWQAVPWRISERTNVPTKRGIYAFTVQFDNRMLPAHGYVLYVGITGDGTSEGTLRKRFRQYFTPKERVYGRPRVVFMLNTWSDHLTFQFAAVPDTRFNLARLERALCNAIVPFAVRNDLSVEFRRAKEPSGL